MVNALPPVGGSGSSVMKAFSQTESIFIAEDVDRYIQFIKDVSAYHEFLTDFNKEQTSQF